MPAALLQGRKIGVRPAQQAAEGLDLSLEIFFANSKRIEGESWARDFLRLDDEEIAARIADGIGEEDGSRIESRPSFRKIERGGALKGSEAWRGTPDPFLEIGLLEPKVTEADLQHLALFRTLFRHPIG